MSIKFNTAAIAFHVKDGHKKGAPQRPFSISLIAK